MAHKNHLSMGAGLEEEGVCFTRLDFGSSDVLAFLLAHRLLVDSAIDGDP